jgi:hypothetical protein
VGFGDTSPDYYDELSYFLSSQQIKILLEPHEWTQILFNNYAGDFSPRSYLTKLNVVDGKVQSILINGQKTVAAHNFIFCGPIKNLKTLLTDELISAKAKHKLAKGPYWTALCLDILHPIKVTDELAMHMLNSTVQDEIGPCAGKFQPATILNDQPAQFSQWFTFIEDEAAEDEENIGQTLKKMKRQIKRAYPESLENVKFERIVVSPSFTGHADLKLNSNFTLPGVENLWISSPQLNPAKNLVGALLQAEMITSSLGVHPMGVSVQVSSESQNEKTL